MAKSTRVAAIAELPLVLTARPNSMRLIVDRALQRHNLTVEPKIEVETLQMALDLIDTTGCYSVFPYSAIDLPLRESRITASSIEKLNISWTIATARDRYESAAMRLFADEMIAESRRKIRDSEWLSAVSNA
jgi:LysR family nitrogen assimilation transcriptional regulator